MNPTRKKNLPREEDFSPASVRKAVLAEAIQHPLTLIPAAAAMLAGAYMGLVDFSRFPFKVALGGAILAVCSWAYQFFVKGDRLAEDHVRKLREKYRASWERDLADLVRECGNQGFHEGAKEARELDEAYKKLVEYLERHSDRLEATRFSVLARECYQEGLVILKKAVSVFSVLRNMREAELKIELRTWEQQAKLLEGQVERDPRNQTRLDALKKRMDSHHKRLELCRERRGAVEQLLAHSEELEAALEAAYLEVADLFDQAGPTLQADTAGNLERAVNAARRVEQRLSAMENPVSNEADDQYLEAGTRTKESE